MYFYVRGCDYHQTTGGFERIEKVKEVFAFRRFPFEIPLVLEDSNFSAIKERNIVRKFFGKKGNFLGPTFARVKSCQSDLSGLVVTATARKLSSKEKTTFKEIEVLSNMS